MICSCIICALEYTFVYNRPMDKFLTPKEAANRLKVSYRTILREIKRGKIEVAKAGRLFLISEEALKKYTAGSVAIRALEVAVAVVERRGQVLLVKRRVKEGKLKWQFPSGVVRYAEKPKIRAEIECLQETGVHCRAIRSLGKRIHPDTKVVISYWLCRYVSGRAHLVDDSENERVEWVNRQLVPRRFTSNTFPPVKRYLLSE